MTNDAVHVEVDGTIACIRLARPGTHNRIDRDVADGIAAAVDRCETTAGVRCVLICADGRDFTVGGDLGFLAERVDDLPAVLEGMISTYHAALVRLATLPVPVVCAVQGAVAGGGLGLLWASDIVIAADDLKLTTSFVRLGLTGDGGTSWALPRLVGMRRALQLIMGSPVIDAGEALASGLVDQVVPAAELDHVARDEARRLADGPTVALGQLRRLYRESTSRTWEEQLAAELAAMLVASDASDARRAVAGFSSREPVRFEGC